ncbi:MAG: periplasmic heavy metal sensor [Verrucomicrobiae bacterium]|nr:periplasmic heavy metal sensor [Verrucomicrobiae bacterium]
MNRGRMLAWSLSTVIVAAIAALFVGRWTCRETSSATDSEAGFHQWLHENLEITSAQEEALLPQELAFESQRRDQREVIQQAGSELAQAIRSSDDADAPEVRAALRKLTDAQGELQRLTLSHFFAMKENLSPEQGEKLLLWTHDSIVNGHHR